MKPMEPMATPLSSVVSGTPVDPRLGGRNAHASASDGDAPGSTDATERTDTDVSGCIG
jgi:hypothetical protein